MKTPVGERIRSYAEQLLYPRRDPEFLVWEREFFDTGRWQPRVIARGCLRWINATRRRRWTVWSLVTLFVFIMLPIALGAVAYAQTATLTPSTTTTTTVTSTNSELSWMRITDSSGVPLSNYVFATNHGSLLHPQDTALSLVLDLEFAGWLVIVTTTIWFIGYALSFEWLNSIGQALIGVANQLDAQIATPLVLITCATIGAFFVAYFVARGFYSRATMQVVFMLGVAIIGPLYLSHPLADVLSSDGILAQGRDVGISVAAGLNGTSTTDPAQEVVTLQRQMTDIFARAALQEWDLGKLVDNEPMCKAEWTAGEKNGNEDQVISGMKACGDTAAYESASNPSVGQMGAGVLLLVEESIMLLFGVYLGVGIMADGAAVLWNAGRTLIGFAGIGTIYGPPQIFLIRSIVDSFVRAFRMAVTIIGLGMYMLVVIDLYNVTGG